jgi:hypothetical protein
MAMSSHHFVREGQEPALFILEATTYAQAEGLLEWAPLVMVSESALEEVLLWGIKIDVVLAPSEKIEVLTSRVIEQAPIKILSAGDAIETGLLFLSNSGQSAVSIMAKAMSDSLRQKIETLPHKLQVTVKTPTFKWALIQSGKFRKWYQASSIIDFSDHGLATRIQAKKTQKNAFELTEDQWIIVESSLPFWIGEHA